MSNVLEWENFGKGSKLPPQENTSSGQGSGGNKDLPPLKWMRLEGGNTYNIRPLGGPVVFYKYVVPHNGEYHSAICEDPRTCPVFLKHQIRPQEKYAINVIDRSDGEIKILEGPFSIFKELKTFWDHTNVNPGKANGADFKIDVTGEGKKKRYACEYTGRTTLTEEERSLIKSKGLFKLEKIYKVTPSDKIEEKLFGASTDAKSEPKQTAVAEDDLLDDLGTDSPVESASDDLDELDI